MPAAARFPEGLIAALAQAKILGVRAGSSHRYTGVWVVVVEGRAFVRSWNDKPTGWHRAFLAEPEGSLQVGGQEVPVRGHPTQDARLQAAVTVAFAAKYPTKGSATWVRGFAEASREQTTLELVPA